MIKIKNIKIYQEGHCFTSGEIVIRDGKFAAGVLRFRDWLIFIFMAVWVLIFVMQVKRQLQKWRSMKRLSV